jgi:hypothetical protein
MDRIIRILTAGKPLEVIDQAIADATCSGCRVLVKAGRLTASFPELNSSNFPELNSSELSRPQKLDSEDSAIASWAEQLSQLHGLVWQRVGSDVLFTKAPAETLKES